MTTTNPNPPQLEGRPQRFYDRLRSSIDRLVGRRGAAFHKTAEFLMLVPDVFVLLWRLSKDSRVGKKNRILLGAAVVYFISPFDLLPEALLGPVGYLNDLVLGAFVLNKILSDTDTAVLREQWSGQGDVLEMIKRVLNAADSLVETTAMAKIRKIVRD